MAGGNFDSDLAPSPPSEPGCSNRGNSLLIHRHAFQSLQMPLGSEVFKPTIPRVLHIPLDRRPYSIVC